jgi:hypothetical protein
VCAQLARHIVMQLETMLMVSIVAFSKDAFPTPAVLTGEPFI